MQSWLNSKSLLFSQFFIGFWALLLAALDLGGWWILHWFGALRGLAERKILGILVLLYLCSVLGWLLLHAMWRLLGNLRKEKVFTEELCLIGVGFYPPFLFAVAAAGFMALIVRIVRNVFQQALLMKDELDLMI